MRKLTVLLGLSLIATGFAVAQVEAAAPKAGTACTKLNQAQVSGGYTYTCIKSGKKLVWSKGVKVAAPTPMPSPTPIATPAPTPSPIATASPSPTPKNLVEGDPCMKMGDQLTGSTGVLECRKSAGNKLVYVKVNQDYSPVLNPTSIDPLTLCQLPDKRTQILSSASQLAIAYPPKPFKNFSGSTGTFKVVVVGIDFSDTNGTGSPSTLWKDDLTKAAEWLKWYTNDKVKLEFVTYDKWLRAPKPSAKYDASNSGARGPNDIQSGGLTTQQISEDYIHTIEDTADLSNTTSIWVYFPENITTPSGAFQPQTTGVITKKYGLVSSQLVSVGADTYQSHRPRWAYFLHEMIHGFGLQGHSPKFLPYPHLNKLGEMSNADGWTNALLPFDSLTWGVANSSDIYCVDKPHLRSVDLTLVPLEREQVGLRSAMIRLNDHQVLVVESHRSDKWGVGEGAGFAGVMVSIIDTTVNTSFDESNPSDPCLVSTGVYLTVPGVNHGTHQPIGQLLPGYNGDRVGVYNGVAIAGDYDQWDLNHVMYTGESLTSVGVKISLIKGGDNDTVRIENADSSVSEYVQPSIPASCLSGYFPKSDNSNGGGALLFPLSSDITPPTNLKASLNSGSASLSWTYSNVGKVKIEFYQISGQCSNAGVSCGLYQKDVWELPMSDPSPITMQVPVTSITSGNGVGVWTFTISANNQTLNLSSGEKSFDPVVLTG